MAVQNHTWADFPRVQKQISCKYDNVFSLGDFNSCTEDSPIKTFWKIDKSRNLIKEPTCFKNPKNPTHII